MSLCALNASARLPMQDPFLHIVSPLSPSIVLFNKSHNQIHVLFVEPSIPFPFCGNCKSIASSWGDRLLHDRRDRPERAIDWP